MTAKKTDLRVRGRGLPPGRMPFLDCEGTARECGEMMGHAWRDVLRAEAGRKQSDKPWWKNRAFQKQVRRLAPHLPDLYRGMAGGAGVHENAIGPRAPLETGGCTSFAVAPSASLDGLPFSGQSKDVSLGRCMEMIVLRARMTDGPSMLSLTYRGWLFGHGFVKGGTAIFRNSLYVSPRPHGLSYSLFGLLALHCPTVEDVLKLLRDCGCASAFHATVADEHGGIVGIENGKGGPSILKPKRGIYAHANNVLTSKRMQRYEQAKDLFSVKDSAHRAARLQERLDADRGRLTPQLAFAAYCDHTNYPCSICRHQSNSAWTGAWVLAEPTRELLHVTRGAPCQNWPTTYRL